nr:uncharacterized protein LOC118878640 [Drosophila suzukii]
MAPRPRSAQTLDDRRSRGTRSHLCRVCRGIHPLRKCNRFLRLSTEKRLRAVLINKYCANCLAHQHSEKVCRSGDTCKKCGENHHTLLHLRESSGSRCRSISPLRPSMTSPRPSASVLRSPSPTPSSRNHSRCSDQFDQPTADPSVASLLQHRSVRSALANDVRAKFNDIRIADEQFHRPATISLVLGSDVYRDVIQPGFLNLDEGLPVAQSTVFGWIVSGSCRQP